MIQNFEEILTLEYFGNTVEQYLYAFGLFVVLFLIFKAFEVFVIVRLKKLAEKTENEFDDELVGIIQNVSPLFYAAVALYFPLKKLTVNETIDRIIDAVFIVIVVWQVIKSLQDLINCLLDRVATKNHVEGKEETAAFHGVKLLVKIVLWAVGLLMILSNLGFDIDTLIASLGIGGIAVALAVQNILGDIFSSFSIYFDKPFQPGDFIVVGDNMGTVKKIGLKTTRIQSLTGEELVISNNELTGARIQNFKKLKDRRVAVVFGLVYGTSLAKLKKAGEIVKKIVEKTDKVRFDRCHFFNFGDFSLEFELVYFVESADYAEYMDVRQEINFGIKKEFEKAKIEMAFPTQTVYVEKG